MRLIACLMAAGLCLGAEAQAPALSPANPYFSVSMDDRLLWDDEQVVLARLGAATAAIQDKDNPRLAGDLVAYEELYRRYTRSQLVNLALVDGQPQLDLAACATTPAMAKIAVPAIPDVKLPGLPEARARLERTVSGYKPAVAAVVDAAATRHRDAFLADAQKRGVGSPAVKGMETPAVASLERDYACIMNDRLRADLLHLIRLANEPAYAAEATALAQQKEAMLAEGRAPLESITGAKFKDRAKEDLTSSPRERSFAGKPAPPMPYVEPTETEIGLALVRELQAYGCKLEEGWRCITPAGVVEYPHVAKQSCLTGRVGWACRVLIHSRIVMTDQQFALAAEKQNTLSPSLSEEVFVLTDGGWRSPSLNARIGAADQRAKVAANRGFKSAGGPLCRTGALAVGAEGLQAETCK